MGAFVIHGGNRLRGRQRIHGAKNAALTQMAAALLTDEPVVLKDVPDLVDVRNMGQLLTALGCQVSIDPEGPDRSVNLHATDRSPVQAHYDVMRTMRAGFNVLGPLLASRGRARVSMPGGCNIGDRPIDLHLRGLRALGTQIKLEGGYIIAEADRLRGARIFLGGPFGTTVLGTANVMCAATCANGVTVIESAACEPEVTDLADLLNKMGARIEGAGSPRITIEGVDRLHGAEHTIMPDRIEAATYIMAAAITNGDVVLDNCPIDALGAVLDRLAEIGVEVESVDGQSGHNAADQMRQTVRIASNRRLNPVQIVTQPHPGFPTDLQAQIMALLCLADGNSMITEKIFPDRFQHVAEMLRMGAQLVRIDTTVLVAGTRHLSGAPVMANDLRASAGLVLAGLAAQGTTTVDRIYHLDRGYEKMETVLQQLGADIERVDADIERVDADTL